MKLEKAVLLYFNKAYLNSRLQITLQQFENFSLRNETVTEVVHLIMMWTNFCGNIFFSFISSVNN